MIGFENTIVLLSLCLGLIGSLASGVFWYRGSVRKEYAAQRDFNHLKNNYHQLAETLADFVEQNDTRFDRVDLALVRMDAKLDVALQLPKRCEQDV